MTIRLLSYSHSRQSVEQDTIHVCDVTNFSSICYISSASNYSMYEANSDLYLINVLLFVSVFD